MKEVKAKTCPIAQCEIRENEKMGEKTSLLTGREKEWKMQQQQQN